MQLCLAQSYAPIRGYGGTNTVKSVEKLLHGIKIDHYVTLDIDAVPVMNDTVGGVEVTLHDDFSMYDPEMAAGETIRLEGKQAEFFVRGRMTVADGTNQSRMTRQEEYITSFIAQFREVSKEDPNKLAEILDKISEYMETDASRDTLIYDASAYEDYSWQAMKNLEGTHTVDEHRFAEFWVEPAALKDLVLDIWFMKEE
jgi:LCP family protein required for cell wall assembly